MADDCITSGYKNVLLGLLNAETEAAVIAAVLDTFKPCSPAATTGGPTVKIKKDRAAAGLWPNAIYYNKDGTTREGSFSGLYKELYGTPVTSREAYICRWWGPGDQIECRSPSTVENFRDKGDIVKGDGEDPPPQNPDWDFDQVEAADKAWKASLLERGLKIHIYHPEHPTIKAATEEVKKSPRTRKAK